MGLFDFVHGFVSFLYGAGSVSGEKDNTGVIHVIADLGQGARIHLGVVKAGGKTISYITPAGKSVVLAVPE